MAEPDPTPLLRLDNVHKSWHIGTEPQTILADINLSLPPATSLAITGPSGSGKSTLLNLIGGLDQPDAGRILIDNHDITPLPEPDLAHLRNRTLGFVFQQHHLLPQCTVLENLLLPCLTDGAASPSDTEFAHHLLQRLDLTTRAHQRPPQLSGGECQRTAVARALIRQPRILLADEPTGALDPTHATTLIDLLLDTTRHFRTALILVTHATKHAQRMQRHLRIHQHQLISP